MKWALVAGEGELPKVLERRAKPELCLQLGKDVPAGAVQNLLNLVLASGCTHLCLAGSLNRPKPQDLDEMGRALFASAGVQAGDSALVDRLIQVIEAQGVAVIGAHQLLPDLLTPEGRLSGNNSPSPSRLKLAFDRVRQHGLADQGQAILSEAGGFLLEGSEGTDALLALAKGGAGSFLLKAAKPQQDLRVDMPAWGRDTVAKAASVGVKTLLMEAGKTLSPDRDEALALAEDLGVTVWGIAG